MGPLLRCQSPTSVRLSWLNPQNPTSKSQCPGRGDDSKPATQRLFCFLIQGPNRTITMQTNTKWNQDPDNRPVTCRQLAVSETQADVVQRHGATVPESPAGADEYHLWDQRTVSRFWFRTNTVNDRPLRMRFRICSDVNAFGLLVRIKNTKSL